ncbi:MAG: hypothetical protein N3B01_00465 [Verrucomicrobiae bacterium]|nr:hypothetical protein [Verrucomicrobiae bacterium]
MNEQDAKLSELLRRWEDIEPSADFDAQVWRRLRQRRPTFADSLRAWVPRPAFALGVAALIGAAAGLAVGLLSVAAPGGLELLGANTLAGRYVLMTQR